MQNVFIINFNSLYEILDEIKENLSFKIIKIENEEDLKNNLDLDIPDFLVISKIDYKVPFLFRRITSSTQRFPKQIMAPPYDKLAPVI